MTIKMVAMGVWGRGSYLADSWNRLDLFIVLAGAVEYCVKENMNLSAIRTIRVLRPLRAINRIPSKFFFSINYIINRILFVVFMWKYLAKYEPYDLNKSRINTYMLQLFQTPALTIFSPLFHPLAITATLKQYECISWPAPDIKSIFSTMSEYSFRWCISFVISQCCWGFIVRQKQSGKLLIGYFCTVTVMIQHITLLGYTGLHSYKL